MGNISHDVVVRANSPLWLKQIGIWVNARSRDSQLPGDAFGIKRLAPVVLGFLPYATYYRCYRTPLSLSFVYALSRVSFNNHPLLGALLYTPQNRLPRIAVSALLNKSFFAQHTPRNRAICILHGITRVY